LDEESIFGQKMNDEKKKGIQKWILEEHTLLSAENSARNTSSHSFNGSRYSGQLAISGIWGMYALCSLLSLPLSSFATFTFGI